MDPEANRKFLKKLNYVSDSISQETQHLPSYSAVHQATFEVSHQLSDRIDYI